MYRSVLFRGCAADRAGAPPVYRATIALAGALGLELWEAPAAGCCGARPDRAVRSAELRRALAPLGEAAPQGLDIVCLSPACRCVVATHMAIGEGQTASPGTEAHVPHVRDIVQVLTEADGLERLRHAVTTPLSPLRVALHATCHADHRPSPLVPPGAVPERPTMRTRPAWLAGAMRWRRQPDATVSGTGSVPTAPRREPSRLADLIAATGATALPDVSLTGRCAAVPVRHAWIGPAPGAAPDVRCLALAVQNGADLLVTPCFLCFGDLNHYQRTLDRAHPARRIPVLHLAQVLGVACSVAPLRLDLAHTAVSARRVLAPFVA